MLFVSLLTPDHRLQTGIEKDKLMHRHFFVKVITVLWRSLERVWWETGKDEPKDYHLKSHPGTRLSFHSIPCPEWDDEEQEWIEVQDKRKSFHAYHVILIIFCSCSQLLSVRYFVPVLCCKSQPKSPGKLFAMSLFSILQLVRRKGRNCSIHFQLIRSEEKGAKYPGVKFVRQ